MGQFRGERNFPSLSQVCWETFNAFVAIILLHQIIQGVPSVLGLALVDLNFECSTVCPILPGQLGKMVEHPNESQPGPRADWTPSTVTRFYTMFFLKVLVANYLKLVLKTCDRWASFHHFQHCIENIPARKRFHPTPRGRGCSDRWRTPAGRRSAARPPLWSRCSSCASS